MLTRSPVVETQAIGSSPNSLVCVGVLILSFGLSNKHRQRLVKLIVWIAII